MNKLLYSFNEILWDTYLDANIISSFFKKNIKKRLSCINFNSLISRSSLSSSMTNISSPSTNFAKTIQNNKVGRARYDNINESLIIKELGTGATSKVYLLCSGKCNEENAYVVKETNTKKNLFYIYITTPDQMDYVKGYLKNKNCPTSIEDINCYLPTLKDFERMVYIGLTEFINEYIIAQYLEQYFSIKKLPEFSVKYFDWQYCELDNHPTTPESSSSNVIENNGQGYYLQEYCSLGTVENLLKNTSDNNLNSILNQVIEQVILALYNLQNDLSFVSGDLKGANVFVKDQSILFKYANREIKSSFTCKIADYGKSSLTIRRGSLGNLSSRNYSRNCDKNNEPDRIFNGHHHYNIYRLYTYDYYSSWYNVADPFVPVLSIDEETSTQYYIMGELYNFQLFAHSRHNTLPHYLSLDTYTFLLSLFLIKNVFQSYLTNENSIMRMLFEEMFYEDEREIILNAIRSYYTKEHDRVSINSVLNILRGKKLKCNLTVVLHNLLFID